MDAETFLAEAVIAFWVLSLLCTPVKAVARWGVLRKAGLAGWKGLIPFYGEYLQYRISWKPEWYWFHLFSVGGRSICYLYFMEAVVSRAVYYTHEELMGMLLLSLPDVVLALIGLCARYLAMEHLAETFGRSKNFALGLYFLHPVFLLILGFGRDRRKGENDGNQTEN